MVVAVSIGIYLRWIECPPGGMHDCNPYWSRILLGCRSLQRDRRAALPAASL